MSQLSRSKRWLLVAALSTSSAAGCKSGVAIPMWNPFAKAPTTNPSLVQSGENSYVQPNMPQPPETAESSWTAPFKKLGDTLSSPFKSADSTPSNESSKSDSISLANKVSEPTAPLHVQLAKVHERAGKLSEAVHEYDNAIDKDPKCLPALLGLAQLYDRLGRYDEALIFYGRAAQVAPDDASVQNDMGLCLARSDKMKEAAAALRRAVSLDPKKVLYRNNLATVLVELNRTDEAYETLQSVHGPAVAHYNVGFLLNKKNRKADALKHFELAAAADPSLKEAHQWVAALGGKPTPSGEKTTTVPVEKPIAAPVTPSPAPTTAQGPTLDKAAAKAPTVETPVVETPKSESPAATVLAADDKPAVIEKAPVTDTAAAVEKPPVVEKTSAVEKAPAPASAAESFPKPTAVTPPAKAPLINAELTNIPRPSIARQAAAETAAEAVAPTKAPSAPIESSFPVAAPKPDAVGAKSSDAKAAETETTADRRPASTPAATLPRTEVPKAAVPPLPEQISTVDVSESTDRSSTKYPTTTAAPKFGASRY